MFNLVKCLFSLAPIQTGVAVVVLCSPIFLAIVFRFVALNAPAKSHRRWFGYRQNMRLVLLTTIGGWWALWDWDQSAVFPQIVRSWPAFADPATREFIFWVSPLATFLVAQTIAYATDKSIAELHWTHTAILRQAFWSVIRFVVPLLLISVAFEAIFNGELLGIIWLVCAFIIFIIGRVFHDKALGVNLRLLKSGELRNRAMAMAGKMNAALRQVYVVPQGKGHLLNAFAGFGSISLTDTLSQHLNRAEVDCTIAHELGHLKLGHTRKTLLALVLVFAIPSLLLFRWPARVPVFRPAIDLFVIFAPFLVFYFFSRRFEYQADQESAGNARNPEIEISSLVKLYRAAGASFRTPKLTEMFLTHPSLIHRVEVIARANGISDARVTEMLRDIEPRTKEHAKTAGTTSL
ncbi:MAG: M48 family metalloprotease [Candidatus Acidiferrales bacterium]